MQLFSAVTHTLAAVPTYKYSRIRSFIKKSNCVVPFFALQSETFNLRNITSRLFRFLYDILVEPLSYFMRGKLCLTTDVADVLKKWVGNKRFQKYFFLTYFFWSFLSISSSKLHFSIVGIIAQNLGTCEAKYCLSKVLSQ